MLNNMDLVSIVITVLNGQANIKRCLESVVNQTYQNLELVIFDDGSTDSTRQIILSFVSEHKGNVFKFDYIDQNIGRSTALNKCLERVTGKFIAIMDADDEMFPDRIALQVRYLNSNTSVSVVGGAQLMHLSDGSTKINRPPQTDNLIKAGLFVRTTMLHPTVMIRREFLVSNGIKYDPDFHLCEDYKLFVDLLYAGAKFANLPNVVNNYDYRRKKGWDQYQDHMVFALKKIWGRNLNHLSINENATLFNHFLNVTGKSSVVKVSDALSTGLFFLSSFKNVDAFFGGKCAFIYFRLLDVLRLLRTSLKS